MCIACSLQLLRPGVFLVQIDHPAGVQRLDGRVDDHLRLQALHAAAVDLVGAVAALHLPDKAADAVAEGVVEVREAAEHRVGVHALLRVAGRVERGRVKVGDKVQIVGLKDEISETTVTGTEMFHKILEYAEAGDNVGTLLRGVAKKDVERGQVLAAPGSIKPHTKFKGQVYVLSKEEGGRHTPFFNNYRPQFYFRTTDVTGVITLPEGTEMCMPGDNVDMDVELITPIAIENGLRFAIREGGRTVGSGVVIAIND